MTEVKPQMESSLTREQLLHMQTCHTYRYYPDALYEASPLVAKMESPVSLSLPGVASLERGDSKIAIAEEYPGAEPGRHWGHVPYSSYLGTDTSRGWYPEIHSGTY